jgi:hypothetical protein
MQAQVHLKLTVNPSLEADNEELDRLTRQLCQEIVLTDAWMSRHRLIVTPSSK